MNKRAFLEGFFTASTIAFGGNFMWQRIKKKDSQLSASPTTPAARPFTPPRAVTEASLALDVQPQLSEAFKFTPIEIGSTQPILGIPLPAPSLESPASLQLTELSDQQVDTYLTKIRNFDAIFASDIYLDPSYESLLLETTQHLARVEAYIGHGNFNLMSFDEMLRYSHTFSKIGAFEEDELNFLEEVFFVDPNRYGFFGQKICQDITDTIPRDNVIKVGNTGHFLLKGESLNLYNQIKWDVGDQLILTSGVRSIVKQMHLFLAKAVEANGNMSRASRSLAPPGHSYHGVGDFDIGKLGYGSRNFTEEFTVTDEYKKIAALDYVNIRYPADNLFGVRFEPWHIKLGQL